MHSSLLQIMLRQLQSTENRAAAELPADLNFQMSDDNEIANLEQQLADPAIKTALVSIIYYNSAWSVGSVSPYNLISCC